MAEPYKYRNPDGSLRLDEMLGERYVRHYTRILESSNQEFREMQLAMAAVAEAPDAYDVPWREQRSGDMTPDGWMITAEGAGEPLASSCQELALLPEVCWDVCGYYSRLGVHWRATKSQIARAQLDLDPGRDDPELSYAVSQLLDPVIRRAYDLMPLGGVFLGDRGVRERIERAAAAEASRRNAEAWWAGEEYAPQDQQKDVLSEWGFDKVSAQEAEERLSGGGFRAGSTSDALGSTTSDWARRWSWYRMYDPYDAPEMAVPHGGADVLERWQAMVGKALSALGIRASFSVGTWPGHGPKSWHNGNKSCIFFINRGEITQDMADEAAKGYAAQVRHTSRNQRRPVLCPFSTLAWTRPSR